MAKKKRESRRENRRGALSAAYRIETRGFLNTKSAKAKGRRVQTEVRDAFLKACPDLHSDDIRCVPASVVGEDLWLSPAAYNRFPFAVECKCVESLNVWEALSQAERHADRKPGAIPLLAFRRNRSRLYVALSLEEFLKLIA